MVTATLASALVFAACGDGDEASPTAAGAGALTEFCDAAFSVMSPPDPDIDFDTASGEEIAAAARLWATEVMAPRAERVVATAPEELADDVAALSGAVSEVADTGDFAAFEAPDVAAAGERFDEFALGGCGWAQLDVTAVDFAFEGLPADVDSGVTGVRFTNEGAEVHELALFRKNDGVTDSAEELLGLSEHEALELVTRVGDPSFADPGDDDTNVFDLEPGDYIAACFIPVGGEDGPPHFTEGMVAEFTVR
jgi:hypothetical protein